MKTLFAWLGLLFLLLVLPLFAMAQTTCFSLGAIMDCSGPSGQSYTQVPTGPTGGVIITDRDTPPYTIITPTQPNAKAFDPTPLTQSSSAYQPYQPMPAVPGTGPVFVPGMETYTYGR